MADVEDVVLPTDSSAEVPQASTSTTGARFAVYRPADASAPLPDLPDSYFEPTLGELQRNHAGQVSKREKYEGPLLTRKLREESANKQAAARRARFPTTRIRVKFGDRTQIETAFPSTSQLNEVYGTISEAFADPATKFVLYQSPPRREFLPSDPKLKGQSLYDLQFAPSSVFYIRFIDEQYNGSGVRPPLRADLLDSVEDLPAPPSFDQTALDRTTQPSEQKSGGSEPVARTKNGTALPKWLKSGKTAHK